MFIEFISCAQSQQRQETRISELQELLAQSHSQNMSLMQTLSNQFNGLSTQITFMSSSTPQQPVICSLLALLLSICSCLTLYRCRVCRAQLPNELLRTW